MGLPLLLIFVALTCAGVVAYGTHPGWASLERGLDIILMTRRLQWPLVLLCVLLCVVLIAMVMAGRRKAWWLIGLLPVLTMFYHLALSAQRGFVVLDNPRFISAEQAAATLKDEDWVVGMLVGENFVAYPYATLYRSPVIVQPEQDKLMILLWSPYANRATAALISREIKPRELEVVSMPANALLVYNARHGQFINGLTGLTTQGEKPIGFGLNLGTERMTWERWRTLHPQTLVLSPNGREPAWARGPLSPAYSLPKGIESGRGRVAMVATSQPAAVQAEQVTGNVENFWAGSTPVLLFRDPLTARLRAFHRDIGEQLTPRFGPAPAGAKPNVLLIDSDTASGWDRTGLAVEGERKAKGQRLLPITVEEDLDWGVMKFWYPQLQLHQPSGKTEAVMVKAPPRAEPASKPKPVRRRPRTR